MKHNGFRNVSLGIKALLCKVLLKALHTFCSTSSLYCRVYRPSRCLLRMSYRSLSPNLSSSTPGLLNFAEWVAQLLSCMLSFVGGKSPGEGHQIDER